MAAQTPKDLHDIPNLQDYRTLWGETYFGSVRVTIYVNTHDWFKGFDGNCEWLHGEMEIDVAPSVAKNPTRMAEILIHELTHAVEYANDPKFLSPAVVDDCTLLAQTMEACLAPALLNMRLAKGAKWPFNLPRRKLKKAK